ncbi:retrovirus group K member 113 Gag polyproteinpolyprotein-like-like [Podarcis lilfordi]|uniref:Gag polyprotein n=1 Tax=Podarcis lilfordi TaxID=74358 RepID=A0AA35K1C1_9SAUR|nr:retrovirus group K member 113 Gag polyproteinpolyprotein-like-like [Podarcis lilfordi]
MLEGIATGYTMLPQDWKDLMRVLLFPARYVVFESEFKHSAVALADPQHSANQLFGAGPYDNIPAQAQLTPLHFSRTVTCVQRAFRKVPVSGQPLSSFVNIKQQHSEPYHQFIDRLKESIIRQIDDTTAQNELMKKLAFENANTDCKKALHSIIHRPKYGLADMIQTCADVGSQSHAMSLLAGAIQAGNKPTGNCFNCKRPGHFAKQCRAPGGGANRNGEANKAKPSKKCPKCAVSCNPEDWSTETSSGRSCRLRVGKQQQLVGKSSGNAPVPLPPSAAPASVFSGQRSLLPCPGTWLEKPNWGYWDDNWDRQGKRSNLEPGRRRTKRFPSPPTLPVERRQWRRQSKFWRAMSNGNNKETI